MSKLVKFFAVLFLLAGAIAVTPGTAAAQHRGGGYHGGHGNWHGGGWHGGRHRGGGWAPGFAFGFGFGNPYGYGGSYYYEPDPTCGWARVRVWRNGHWVLRRAWRCW